jgi:NDMA-dependent alcohol dehydrogenase
VKINGAVLWEIGQDWSIEEIELGDPRQGEVKVQLAATGMCHSDDHLLYGDTPMELPVIGGHEGAGVVVEVGPGTTDVKVGDHVVLSFVPACGRCLPCSSGHQNLCDLGMHLLSGGSISDGTCRVSARGKDVQAFCLLGTFAPYVVVHEASVVKIPDYIPLDLAALVGCGVPTGWGSSVYAADVKPGENVVVMGAGGVGMNAIQGAAGAGARRVIAVDPIEFKRESAVTFGATDTFASAEQALEGVRELTWGRMADKVIVAVSRLETDHVKQALDLVGKNGTVVLTAVGSALDVDVPLNLTELTFFQKRIQGAVFGGGNPRFDIPQLLGLWEQGKLNLANLITHRYKLEEINQAYRDQREGRIIRGIIEYP